MTTAWNSRDGTFHFKHEDDEASFQKHDELVRRFRLAHPRVETIDSKGVMIADWPVLLPIQRVKLARYWQN